MRALVVAALLAAPALAAESAAPDAAPWQAKWHTRAATRSVSKRSQYITMPDGTRLAADIYLPADLKPGARVPVLFIQNRYYRSSERKSVPDSCHLVGRTPAYFVGRGYALVHVDVRGTGASFGTRRGELAPDEVADGGALVDWIVAQPWSSGAVAAFGQSYLGTAAELLMREHRPALKAIAPVSSTFDAYADLYFPGGILNATFRDGWGASNRAQDADHPDQIPQLADVAGPCPVDDDHDGSLRRAAIAEHAGNFDSAAATGPDTFRDDAAFARGFPDLATGYAATAHALPVLSIEASMDAAYARSGVDRLLSDPAGGQRLILAAGDHGAHDFYAPGVTSRVPSAFDQNAELLAFFDHYLMGSDNGYDCEPRVRWFVTGANAWRAADNWPTPARTVVFTFASGHRLDVTPGPAGADVAIPADAATGDHSRWNTSTGAGAVFYAERSAADATLLTYTSDPLPTALEVTGSPVVHLRVADTAGDGDYFVYLEEVDPAGKSFIVGEGEVRASRRGGQVKYTTAASLPGGRRADSVNVSSGAPLRLDIALIPVAHRFLVGSRIRITLAGSDAAHFASSPLASRRWTVAIGKGGSDVTLPIAQP